MSSSSPVIVVVVVGKEKTRRGPLLSGPLQRHDLLPFSSLPLVFLLSSLRGGASASQTLVNRPTPSLAR